jgi:hypothetical protein
MAPDDELEDDKECCWCGNLTEWDGPDICEECALSEAPDYFDADWRNKRDVEDEMTRSVPWAR